MITYFQILTLAPSPTYQVLMLPNLLSGQGRIALMTLAIGFMIDGPLASIQENIKKVAESFTCLYKLLNQVCYGIFYESR